ncbi:glycoside hydrolase family 25 protein [Corynebacterium sp. CNJ-954]|uniref:glycoside hydrolase family 25 protein n=1 Tax=Corynebacterium sp. CNJ-954 TaxID=1904962 RepID=UPI00210148FF|nr:GH25 family lysozyme [Corynebacterium sp. CNJ-954]
MTIKKAPAALLTACLIGAALGPAAHALNSVNGVDVSSHQNTDGPIRWIETSLSGQRFAYVKATEGTGYINPTYLADSNIPKYVGMAVGSYHYARPSLAPGSAVSQAHFFANTSIVSHFPTLPPVLDIEDSGGLNPTQLQAWVREYLQVVKLRTGRDAMIYTYPNFWRTAMGNTTEFSDHPLWIAHYGTNTPDIPGGWEYVTIHQYSSTGRVAGINNPVDLNRFNGNAAQLARFLR